MKIRISILIVFGLVFLVLGILLDNSVLLWVGGLIIGLAMLLLVFVIVILVLAVKALKSAKPLIREKAKEKTKGEEK